MSEHRTRRYLHPKVNINYLLHTILDIGNLNEQLATRSEILAQQSANGTNQQPLLDVIA